jgi:hypothetical protein
MKHHPTPTLNPSPQGGGKLALLLGSLIALVSFMNEARGNSQWFTVEIKSIEAMLVDRATGQLSPNIVDADSKVFVSSSGMNDTPSKSADDVLLRISFEAKGDGNVQPPITVAVLEHVQFVDGPGLSIAYWESVSDYPGIFVGQEFGTVTALLKNVTCSKLDVVVKVGTEHTWGESKSVLLPFECKKK